MQPTLIQISHARYMIMDQRLVDRIRFCRDGMQIARASLTDDARYRLKLEIIELLELLDDLKSYVIANRQMTIPSDRLLRFSHNDHTYRRIETARKYISHIRNNLPDKDLKANQNRLTEYRAILTMARSHWIKAQGIPREKEEVEK